MKTEDQVVSGQNGDEESLNGVPTSGQNPAGLSGQAIDQMATKTREPRTTAVESAPKTSRYRAPALEKGLDVIELLAAEKSPLNLSAISQRLGRSSGELFRMLQV